MIRRSLPLAAALLAACQPLPPTPPATPAAPPPALVARASAAVDELIRINRAAQAAVELFLPWLSPERAEKVRAAAALVDAAIARVALARDFAAQADAIAAARAAIADYKWLAGG